MYRSHDHRSRHEDRRARYHDDDYHRSREDYHRPSRHESRFDQSQRWPPSQSRDRGDKQRSSSRSARSARFDDDGGHSSRKRCGSSSTDKPFTIVQPAEGSDFTIVTNKNNDFEKFTDDSVDRRYDIYSQLSLKQSNYFIFGSKSRSDVLKMSFLYAVARLIYEGETDESLIPAIAAAEFAADYLPSNRRLFGSEADVYFKRVMAKAVRDPNFILKVRPNASLYAALEEFGLPRVYPTPKPEQLAGEQYMRILQILSTSLDPEHFNCDLVVTLTAVAPCLQLDNVSQSFLRRLERTVLEELRMEIRVDIRSTGVFFEQYLREASEQEVEEMLVYWRLTIPEPAERLKKLLRRMPGNGLLPITLIGRAMAECDDFPWEKTLLLYPDDWRAADKAIRVINNDPFYGYRRDKSDVVHPRHYQNLAWVSRQLCIAKLADDYPDLDMWVEEPAHSAEVKRLLAMYMADSQQEDMDVT